MLANEVTKENLNEMVLRFYAKVLNDDVVGPFFIEKLGENLNNELWKPHIELLTNFWASIALGDPTYRGNPFAPHLDIQNLSALAFQRWLELFGETLDGVYEAQISASFKQRSAVIAGNFMRNLGL